MKPDGTISEADHRLRIDELGAVHASVRRVLHLRVEQARVRELRAVHRRRRRARRSRCASPTPTASTGCRCRRPTARRWRGRRAASGGAAGQLFLAQWNHEKALEALKQRAARESQAGNHEESLPHVTSPGVARSSWRLVALCRRRLHAPGSARHTRQHVETLASPRLRGTAGRIGRRAAGQRLHRRAS